MVKIKVALIIYDGFSLLNFAEIYEILNENYEVKICGFKEQNTDKNSLKFKAEIFSQSLFEYENIVLCDGEISKVINDEIFLGWIRSAVFAKRKICFKNSAEIFTLTGFENFEILENAENLGEILK